MIEAEYIGANSLLCVSAVDDFTQVTYVNDASVSVLWNGPDVMYFLETDVDPLTGILVHYLLNVCILACVFSTVILYNCSALAETCSSCLSVSNLLSLDCGWCHDSGDCAVTKSCPADSNFTADGSDTCPLPQITMVCSMLQCDSSYS